LGIISDYFNEVVEASSSRVALYKFAKCFSGVTHAADIEWETSLPKLIHLGTQNPEPAFMVGDGQLYQIRKITAVKPAEIECPTCNGIGKTQGYVKVEP